MTRHISIVGFGNAIALGLPILATPLLAAGFGNSALGIYFLFLALAQLALPIVSLRLEHGLIVDGKPSLHRKLFLSLAATNTVSAAILVALLVFLLPAVAPISVDQPLITLALLSALLNAWTQIGFQALVSQSLYAHLTFFRCLMSGSIVAMQLAALGSVHPLDLIESHLFGQGMCVLALLVHARSSRYDSGVRASGWRDFVYRHRDFPRFDTVTLTINTLANQTLVLGGALAFSDAIVGQIGLAQRLLGAPVNIVAAAILEVFKNNASEELRDTNGFRNSTTQAFKRLVVLSAGVYLFFVLIGILGHRWIPEDWRLSLYAGALLIPLMASKFVASPLSYTFYLSGSQKRHFTLSSIMALLGILSLAAGHLSRDPLVFVTLFSITGTIMYVLYIRASLSFSRRHYP